MLERIQLPTDNVEELSRVHQECEQITIANFLKAAIFDSNLTFQKQMKVRIENERNQRSYSWSLSEWYSHVDGFT